jgi:hypothetical protein
MGRNGRTLVESKYDARFRYASLQAIFENVIKASQNN